MILNREPALIATAVRAIILAATAFGLNWDAAEVAAVMLAVEAVLAVFVRRSVTANVNVRSRNRR